MTPVPESWPYRPPGGRLYNRDGLDIDRLKTLSIQFGNDCVNQYAEAERMDAAALKTIPLDILCPCARPSQYSRGRQCLDFSPDHQPRGQQSPDTSSGGHADRPGAFYVFRTLSLIAVAFSAAQWPLPPLEKNGLPLSFAKNSDADWMDF